MNDPNINPERTFYKDMLSGFQALTPRGGDTLNPASDVNVSDATSALIFNLVVFVILVFSYEIFSRLLPSVYAAKQRPSNKLGNGGNITGGSTMARRFNLPFSWVPFVIRTSWSVTRRTGGLDAYFFLRYVRMCLRITVVSSLWSLAVLCPVFFTGGYNAQGWYHISMANVPQGDWRMWLPVGFLWFFTFYVFYVMDTEYKHYLELRMQLLAGRDHIRNSDSIDNFLPPEMNTTEFSTHIGTNINIQSDNSSVSNNNIPTTGTIDLTLTPPNHLGARTAQMRHTILVESIPHGLRSDTALYGYFDALFPNKVHSASVVLNIPDLQQLASKRHRTVRRLEKSIATREATGRRPTHVIGRKRFRMCGIETLPVLSFGGRKNANNKTNNRHTNTNTDSSANNNTMTSLDMDTSYDNDDDDDSFAPTEDMKRGDRVDSINYYTKILSILNEKFRVLQEEKKTLAEIGNDSVSATQWLSHMWSMASDAAATTLEGKSSKQIDDGLILGFRKGRGLAGIIRHIGLDFIFGGFTFLNRNLDVFVDTIAGSPTSSTGFVTFTDLATTACAVRAPLSHDPDVLKATMAPDPREIVWENAHINQSNSNGREMTANFLLGLGAILWSIPVAAIQALATVERIAQVPGMAWMETFEGGRYSSFINGYLPVVALLTIITLLPLLFEWIAVKFEDRKTKSSVQNSILGRYFYYQIANIYITVTAGSLWSALSQVVDHPGKILDILGKCFPTVVGYFVTFLMTKTLAGLPIVMMRFVALVRMLFLKLCFRQKFLTQRELDEVYKNPKLLGGYEYPNQLLVIIICFTYACISPVILPVGAIYFLGALLVYKKQVLLVYAPDYESGGTMFPAVCHRTLIGLICGQITSLGYTIIREGFYQAIVLLPLPFITFIMMQSFQRCYVGPGSQLSLEKAVELDKDSMVKIHFREDFFKQPILAEGIIEPMPYRVQQHTQVNPVRTTRNFSQLGVLHEDSEKIV